MKETLKYWNDRATENKDARAITHYDVHQREFEIEFIAKRLNIDQSVLDLGCGNGYTTGNIKHLVKYIKGVDFSEEMIKRAKQEVGEDDQTEFEVGDARMLSLDRKFDAVITQRCLINILDWNAQKEALVKIADHLVSGGYYLMVEGAQNGKRNLNGLRKSFGLDEIPKVEYNLDFDEEELGKFMSQYFELEELVTFGQYEYITRIVYPMSIAPENPQYGSVFHDIALKAVKNQKDFHPEISKLKMWVWKKK